MDRRTFIKNFTGGAIALGVGLGAGFGASSLKPSLALAASYPDLVAIRGTNVTAMFDRGLEALGGLGNFIKPGQTVLVKPNIGFAVSPDYCATTNPALLSHIVKNIINIGAKKVYVFDNGLDNWKDTLRETGLGSAATDAGATVAPGNQEKYFQKVTLPGSNILTETQFHETFLEADVIINLPILKQHSGAKMTAALKNMMGAIWDRRTMHRLGLDETIPSLMLYKKPALNVVEAVRVMLSGGPRGYDNSKYLTSQMMIISPDPVAADAASAKILAEAGISEPGYIAQAAAMGLGVSDLSTLNIQRLTA